jgi:hypothetical protein
VEIAICPNCGAVIKQKVKGCGACGAAQSKFAATMVPTLASAAAPMVVSVAPDRLILERIVSSRTVATLIPGSDSTYGNNGGYNDTFNRDNSFQDFIPNLFGTTVSASPSSSVSPSSSTSSSPDMVGSPSETVEGYGSGNGHGNGNGNSNGNGNGNGHGNGHDFFSASGEVLQNPQVSQEIEAASESTQSKAPADFFATDPSTATVAPWEMEDSNEGNNDTDVREDELASSNDSNGNSEIKSESMALNQFSFNQNANTQEESTPFSSPVEQDLPSGTNNEEVVEHNSSPTELAAEHEQEIRAPKLSAQTNSQTNAPNNAAANTHDSTRADAASAKEAPFDVHREQPAPSRPHVAAPDFFASDKAKENSQARSGTSSENARPAKAATAAAFDFFADSASSSKKSSSSSTESQSRESKESRDNRTDKDAHGTFESLLNTKSRPTGGHPEVDMGENTAKAVKGQKPSIAEPKSGSVKLRVKDDDDDDNDDDFDPREKAKAKKKLPVKRSRDLDDDEDDDEDDDDIDNASGEDEDDEIPQRRSFSGSAASLKNAGTKMTSKNSRSREIKKSNDDDEDDDASRLRNKFASGQGLFTLAGFPVGIKLMAITAAIVGCFAFAIFHVLGNVASLTAGQTVVDKAAGLAAMNPEVPTLSGDWRIRIKHGPQQIIGQMNLDQSGTKITGRGQDRVGPYTIVGFIDTNRKTLNFTKRFVDPNNRETGPPIFFVGNILLEHIPLHVVGVWEYTKKSGSSFGYLNKASTSKIKGEWLAQLDRSKPPTEGTIAERVSNPFQNMGGEGTKPAKAFNAIDFLTGNGIFVFIGVGAFLVIATFSMFGPTGQINIWITKQYIPTQVRAQHNKVKAQLAKGLKKGSLPLGQRTEWKWWFPVPWIVKDLALPPEMRKVNPHVLVLGQGGKGKTRLVANMVAHDIMSDDRAVVVIDSDGTLVDLLARWISAQPKAREIAKRVILIDPTHKGNTSAFNPLQLGDMGDVQTAAGSIVYGFKAIYTEPPGSQSQWNAQTADILRNAVLLLMANNKTLTDLPNLLNDNDFRDVLLENVERKKDERIEFSTLLDQWGRYKKLARTDQWITWVEPILNRVNPMLSNPRIRSILTKPEGDLHLLNVIMEKKILLVKIPQGEFGQDANLLGSLVVSGVKQAALTLSSGSASKQNPVALYLDNFDTFIEKETLENITSETKKFKIGLVGVTKSLQHLPEDFRNELIINIGTLITFALSKKDGDLLGPQMFPIDGRKIKNTTMTNFFNPVNSTPQFELVSDEEKLNIDKVVRQEENFLCLQNGRRRGTIQLKIAPI